jgi:hypothetical protein
MELTPEAKSLLSAVSNFENLSAWMKSKAYTPNTLNTPLDAHGNTALLKAAQAGDVNVRIPRLPCQKKNRAGGGDAEQQSETGGRGTSETRFVASPEHLFATLRSASN